ncbi:hypothetical protein [Sinomonas susongensis]|uniref:hypothetical protein n=1 Tax=Sinomonas susongensis TaxID=1324851 RepID=UPI00110914EC|nr:hypothetical protein [Sinomonas susongensis]
MEREHGEAEFFLDFWGVKVRALCHPSDIEDLKFFYGSFVSAECGTPDVSLRLRCNGWPSRGFFASTLANDRLEKSIELVDHHASVFSIGHTFQEWSGVPSPLPPFATSRLRERLAIYSGAAVRLTDGRIAAIVGPHYIGKTSLVLALCQEHGAQLVSDSIIVMDTRTQSCLTYQVPIGFRHRSLDIIIPTLDALDYRLTVSRDTGLVALVRPEAILGRHNSAGGPISKLIVLKASQNPTVEIMEIGRPNLGWFTRASNEAIETCLPETALEIHCGTQTSPAERAAAISEGVETL